MLLMVYFQVDHTITARLVAELVLLFIVVMGGLIGTTGSIL